MGWSLMMVPCRACYTLETDIDGDLASQGQSILQLHRSSMALAWRPPDMTETGVLRRLPLGGNMVLNRGDIRW
jgi:hypothetical protein